MGYNDKEWKKLKNIKGLLEHPGWIEFQTKILDKLDYHIEQINQINSRVVKQDDLDNLNYHVACKNILNQILNVEEELLEDIESSSEDADVKQESEVFVENK